MFLEVWISFPNASVAAGYLIFPTGSIPSPKVLSGVLLFFFVEMFSELLALIGILLHSFYISVPYECLRWPWDNFDLFRPLIFIFRNSSVSRFWTRHVSHRYFPWFSREHGEVKMADLNLELSVASLELLRLRVFFSFLEDLGCFVHSVVSVFWTNWVFWRCFLQVSLCLLA